MLPPSIGYELIDSSDVDCDWQVGWNNLQLARTIAENFGIVLHYIGMSKKRQANENGQSSRYHQILLDKRASALASLGAKADSLAKAERITEEDQAQYSLEEAVSLRLNGHEYMQLRQIQEALDRLKLGDFGICLACDEPIPAKRLTALPWAKYCVKCQEQIADGFVQEHPERDE
jgi:DnaK suppressor protein